MDSSREAIALPGGWPDAELLVIDLLGAVRDDDGVPLIHRSSDLWRVDVETPDPIPKHFIRVADLPGRGGIGPHGVTAVVSLDIEVDGPTRRSVKRMIGEVTELLLGLDRGGAHRGVLVDASYSASADAGEPERDEDDRRRGLLWTLEWRRHFGDPVYVA